MRGSKSHGIVIAFVTLHLMETVLDLILNNLHVHVLRRFPAPSCRQRRSRPRILHIKTFKTDTLYCDTFYYNVLLNG